MAVAAPAPTEESLAAILLSGKREALNTIYRRYGAILMGFISGIVTDAKAAEEVLQASFVEIWVRRNEYDPSVQRLFPWLLRVARAQALLKAPVQQKIINDENLNSKFVVNNDGILNAEYPGLNTQAEKNAYLNGLQDTVLNLMYVNGYSVAEVAGTVKISAEDVKRTLRGAMNKVKSVQHG